MTRLAELWQPLPFRLAFRELRGGLQDFKLFLACLVIGTLVIATVGSLSETIRQSIFFESKTLLGGDLSLTETNHPLAPDQILYLKGWGRVSSVLDMHAMVSRAEDTALIDLKGIDDTYPLLGRLDTEPKITLPLEPGTVVVAAELLDRLSVHVGDFLTLGTGSFKIIGIIKKEPDSISGAFGLGPRVMAREDDLTKAGLTGSDELINYHTRLLLNQPNDMKLFEVALASKYPKPFWTLRSFHDANQSTSRFVARLELFLTLAGLATLLIGGIGILNATQTYIGRKAFSIATMKALGAEGRMVISIYGTLIFFISLCGATCGAILGAGVAHAILPFLAKYFPVTEDHSFNRVPFAEAIWFGLLIVTIFVMPALARCTSVRPALLFRGSTANDFGRISKMWILADVSAILVLAGSLVASAADKKIALGFMLAALVDVAFLALITLGLKAIARHTHFKNPSLRLAAGNIHRPGSATFSVILSIGTSLTVLIALIIVEGNFRHELTDALPQQAPSVFFIDIQPEEVATLSALIAKTPGVSEFMLKPMVRGRIATLNGIPVRDVKVKDDAKWALESDRSLSYAADPPLDNPITKGKWWDRSYRGPPLVSLDQRLAQGMGLKIGDKIGLNILDENLDATIANLREVNYLTLKINFSLILSPGTIEKFPSTFLASIHLEGGKKEKFALIRAVTKEFPNISSIDMADQLLVITQMVEHIALAIRLIALTTVFCGVLVLASSLLATLEQRSYETTIFKILGAGSRTILLSFLVEWTSLAIATASLAALLGTAGAIIILYTMNWPAYQFLPSLTLETCAAMISIMLLSGMLIHYHVFSRRSLAFLRDE